MGKVKEERDPLTGFARKGAFDTALASHMGEEGASAGVPVSVAFLDIDHFMAVNEKYGHAKGDEVILAIGAHLERELMTDGARLYRIGGDEFAALMPGVEKETAFLRLEAARRSLAGLDVLDTVEPRPTICAGVATWPDDGSTRQEVVRKTDDALFRAKSSGKDRVAIAREERKVPKTSHYTQGQLDRLAALSAKEGVGEAELLREALDDLLKKYAGIEP